MSRFAGVRVLPEPTTPRPTPPPPPPHEHRWQAVSVAKEPDYVVGWQEYIYALCQCGEARKFRVTQP